MADFDVGNLTSVHSKNYVNNCKLAELIATRKTLYCFNSLNIFYLVSDKERH